MPPPLEDSLAWRLGQLEEWRREIESLKPEVIADRLPRIERRLDFAIKLMITLIVTIIAAAAAVIGTLLVLIAQQGSV